MKAIYLTKYGDSKSSFEFREVEKPKPGPGEIVIEVQAFGLNFADVIARRGLYPDAPKNPAVLGYDVAGTVYEIGVGVDQVEVGQDVFALTRFGGYAQYAVAQIEAVAPVPAKMDYTKSTALATQACTAYFCAEEALQMHAGDHVLIQAAAGGVGIILVQLAQHHGCIVYGTASSKKQDFLRQLGVDVPIDYTKEDFYQVIKNRIPGVDIVFDSIGGKTFKRGFKLLNPGGRIISYGAASQMSARKSGKLGALKAAWGFGLFTPIQLLMRSTAIIGVNMLRIADNRPHIFHQTLNNVSRLATDGVINPVMAKVFQADQIAEAHDYLESRKSIGKIALQW